MINRKNVLALFALCALEFAAAQAQGPAPAPAAAPVEPGISPEMAADLRRQAAEMDEIKNALPNAEALANLAKSGVGKVITDQVMDQTAAAIAGVDEPNTAVTNTMNVIIKTDRMFDTITSWHKVAPNPEQTVTDMNTAEMRASHSYSSGQKLLICGDPPPYFCNSVGLDIDDLVSNPLQSYANECVIGTGVKVNSDTSKTTGEIVTLQCRVADRMVVPTVTAITRQRTLYEGWSFANYCTPCANAARPAGQQPNTRCIGIAPFRKCF